MYGGSLSSFRNKALPYRRPAKRTTSLGPQPARPRAGDADGAPQLELPLCRAGRRPRHDHQCPHPRRAETRRTGLDHCAQSAADPRPARGFQLSLFDERDLAEITAPEFPGERLVVCKNPLLAEERARKREDLLQATEAALAKLADQIARGTGPKGQDKIARAVGRIENRYKLAKLFDIAVAEDGFSFA